MVIGHSYQKRTSSLIFLSLGGDSVARFVNDPATGSGEDCARTSVMECGDLRKTVAER